ncbi:MAG: right-handed parallel beta-helix repeat-containing protein [Candidatus Methanoperedens sp.]|nr:right-handed parallel beta-helix repeat-containing protein [Candidatus Methanoperedens sp.]MCZ7406548.1 right-handed parallel beta-helix repeat-containing protein [Candidatus Methanoperedens sp.]
MGGVDGLDGIAGERCNDCSWQRDNAVERLRACGDSQECVVTQNGPECKEKTECTSNDRCVVASHSPGGGCIYTRSPGCDQPDDNLDSSTKLQLQNTQSKAIPDLVTEQVYDPKIGVLNNGFAQGIISHLSKNGEQVGMVNVKLDELDKYSILVVPSGGLHGVGTKMFKSNLEKFVNNGGILVVFDQQVGFDYNSIPGNLEAFGWQQDQSCQYGSAAMTSFHPILSGQLSTISSFNVDGFFTKWPENATIVLTRVKNGFPVLVTYPHGHGMVMVSTLYSDYSNTLHQETSDEQILMRDMTAWLRGERQIPSYLEKDGPVETLSPSGVSNFSANIINVHLNTTVMPEFAPGDTVNLSVNVSNLGNKTADRVVFKVYDPVFLLTTVNVSTSIPANGSKNVSFEFNTDSSSRTGVWFALYTLYSGNEEVGAGDAGSFALGVKLADLSLYNITLTLRSPDNKIMATKNVSTTILPGKNQTVGIEYTPPSGQYGIWYLEYQAQNNIGEVTSKGVKMFSLSKFSTASSGWKYPGNFSFTITSDTEDFMMGQPANFTFNIWNFGDVDKTVKVTWGAIHHNWAGVFPGGWDYGMDNSVFVQAHNHSSINYTLPKVVTYDRLRAVFYVDGKVAGYADRGINLVTPIINAEIDINRGEYYGGDEVLLNVSATNYVGAGYDNPINLSIYGPENQVVFSNSTIVTFSQYSVEEIPYNYTILEDAKPGIYHVSVNYYYTYQVERTISKNFVVLPVKLQLINKTLPDFITPGSNANISFLIQNTGSTGNVTFNLSLKDNVNTNYTNSSTFSLARGNNITLNFSIPVNASDYIDGNKYILSYTDGTMNGRKEYSDKIEVVYDMLPSYRQGENLTFNATVHNIGETVEIINANFNVSDLSFQDNSDITLYPGDKFTRSFSIPITDETVSGVYDIVTKIGEKEYRTQFYIPPASLQLNLSDTEYSGNDDIMVGIENSGGNGTLYDLNIQLKDTKGNIVGDISETDWLGAGEFTNRTLTIPDQATSGKYYLIARADYDSKYSDLFRTLNISGLEAGLSVETKKKIYLDTDEKIVLSNITNGNKALENGNLHLQIMGRSEATLIDECKSINDPGEYALNKNITSTQSPCIQIWSDDVTLDGRGFTIDGLNKNNYGTGVEISGETHPSKVTIENLKIKNWGYGIEINGDYEIIKNNELTYNNYAIIPYRANYNLIEGNILDKNEYGIHPQGYLSQVGNTYRGNIITNTTYSGIDFDECDCGRELSDTTIEDNVIINSERGIFLYSYGQKIYNSMIRNNIIRYSLNGIYMYGNDISNITVTGNTITDSDNYGIYITGDENTIYNNYLNNTDNAYDSGSGNVWNITEKAGKNIVGGPYLGGNFWANPGDNGFSQTCTDDGDGFCDSSYTENGVIDELPLAPVDGMSPMISNILSKKDISANIYSSKIPAMNVLAVSTDTILWEDDISVTNDSNSFYQLEPINAGTLGNAVGKFFLQGTMTSETGQIIAKNEYAFYVIPENTSLETELNKKIYRPDENVTFKIKATNYAGEPLNDVLINIDVDGIFQNSTSVSIGSGQYFNLTLNLPENLKGEGSHSITSNITQDGTVLAEIQDDYKVSVPSVETDVTIPEIVGIAPFFIDVILDNTGEVNASVNVDTGDSSQSESLMPGEIKLLRFENQINANKTIYVNISGDLDQTNYQEVVFGDSVNITLNTSRTYLPGKILISYSIENGGFLDAQFNLTFRLDSDSMTIENPLEITLPVGNNMTGLLVYNDLTAGEYVLSYFSDYGNGSKNFTIAPAGAVIRNLNITNLEGVLVVNSTIGNHGGERFSGNMVLGSEFYQNESQLDIEPGEEINLSYIIDTANVSEGLYTITLEVLKDGIQVLSPDIFSLIFFSTFISFIHIFLHHPKTLK